MARELTRASAAHAEAFGRLALPGKLRSHTKLNLANLLRPATQPGSKLDYTPEPEVVTITVRSDAAVAMDGPGLWMNGKPGELSFTTTVGKDSWQELAITMPTPARWLEISYHTSIDPRPRALGIGRFIMPFATHPGEVSIAKASIPDIEGGDWERGRRIFFGKAACSTCHQFNGEGHAVGPDLSNTIHRDYAAVFRDIQDPSAAINPDAVAYKVDLKDGGSLVGVRVGETDGSLKFAVPGGQVITVEKANIAASNALEVSLMPPGLTSALSEQEVKDLMTFLFQARERDR